MEKQSKHILINTEEFDKALNTGVELKKNIVTTYKNKNKITFNDFSDIMFEINTEIKEILNKKKKYRTDDDNKKLKLYKKEITKIYKQTQDLCLEEINLEEGKLTKIEKIVDKVVPVIKMLKYIGNTKLEEAFEKAGIKMSFIPLEQQYNKLDNDNYRDLIKSIFSSAKSIKQQMIDDNTHIETDIYQTIPIDLQYDKDMCLDGIKSGDFKKLVDLKTKLVMATDPDTSSKVTDKIEQVAEEKQFDISRTELVRDKILTMIN